MAIGIIHGVRSAPQGQTPVHYSWDRHVRLAVISALTVSLAVDHLSSPWYKRNSAEKLAS